jgi:predicted helicase
MSKAKIYYYDIGDYLSREEKLAIIQQFGSVENMETQWQILQPNEHGDWLNLRDDAFGEFIPIGDKDDKNSQAFFNQIYSRGLASARDAWCYNSLKPGLETNIKNFLIFYNEQREAFQAERKLKPKIEVEEFVTFDSTRITWNRGLKEYLEKNKPVSFDQKCVTIGLYRPYFKQCVYFSRDLNDMVYQLPKLFPTPSTENRVICVSGLGGSKENSTIITNSVPDLNCLDSGTQCFPLYYYEERAKAAPSLFDASGESEYIRRDGVSDFILAQARARYGERVSKEDIFYYVYGFLHSAEYRARFSADLKKMLPRLPLVESPKDFWVFSKAGRALADLHLGYDNFASAPKAEDIGVLVKGAESGHFRVEKMRFPSKDDKSRILYNSQITVENIPAEAYEYQVNGKSAIEWVMERYAVTTHKDSGIKNDPNDWAEESGNPRYILDVLLSVIRLSVETVKVVRELPGLGL